MIEELEKRLAALEADPPSMADLQADFGCKMLALNRLMADTMKLLIEKLKAE